jgi:hypothetical protein
MPRKTARKFSAMSLIVLTVVSAWLIFGVERKLASGFHGAEFAAMSILPCALGALAVVLILQGQSGEMKFEALGFKFSGKGSAVVLWIGAFIAMMAMVLLAAKFI